MADNEELLVYAEKELNKARTSLPDIMCVSNEDMDPKNIMWDNGNPWVIDLECLDYGNPISHALQLALQWSGITTCNMDIEKMVAFFDGYLEAYDNCFRAYSGVFGLAYTWVEWLEYNIQRALGACIDETERMMGICYYELLLESNITEVQQYELPKGYRFVSYTDNDRDAWIDIEMSAKEFVSYEQGLEAWNRYYAAKLDELPSRMFFIETDEGEKIATATAFYDIYGRDTSGDGWLHWVAIKQEYQGKPQKSGPCRYGAGDRFMVN